MRLWVSYGVMAVVLAVAVVVGTRDTSPPSADDRARAIAQTIACPTCDGQSVAESDAPAARAIRNEIDRRVSLGESDDDIRDYIANQLGDDLLLRPTASGFAGLVWVVPVVAVVLALGGVVMAFRRWRTWETP